MELSKQEKLLLSKAVSASKKAYSPYSKYQVGAALLTEGNTIYTGCNVENSSYSLSLCAERVAAVQAVIRGEKKFKLIVVYVHSSKIFSPCGACRQFLAEFSPDMKVIYANKKDVRSATIRELLPEAFSI